MEVDSTKSSAPLFSEELAQSIEAMGFLKNQAQRAAFYNQGADTETAMNWLVMHLDDPDINDPLPTQSTSSDEPMIDQAVVETITAMGFSKNQAERASFNNKGASADVAMNWLFMHLEDFDINDPLPPPTTASQGGQGGDAPSVDNEVVEMIVSAGFTKNQAERASFNNKGANAEVAMNWLFMHLDDPDINDPLPPPTASKGGQDNKDYDDGEPIYNLFAFVNHIGTSTKSGHYVCHIRKEGKWIKFNDDKVHISQHPPRDCAYMYIFERQQ